MVRNLFHTILLTCMLLVSSINAQTTAIPDEVFEQSLIDQGIDSDGMVNGIVLTSDISGVTILDISNRYIVFLTGIEDFESLTELYCQGNNLFDVNVSHNTKLKILNCSNQIDDWLEPFTLNVSENPNLEYLNCSGNDLSSLSPSLNPNLKTLICSSSRLRGINVSQNTKLEYLNCANNYFIHPGGDVEPFSNLILGNNTNLKTINCSANEISNLDLSGIPALTYLNCAGNKLAGLSIAQNMNLEKLYCSYNELTSLYLDKHSAITTVLCNNNQLTILNVKNDNNDILTEFDSQYNTLLTCIDVDDAVAANAGDFPYNSWLIDDITTYSENCVQTTIIPDPYFEQALIDLGIDIDGLINQHVLTSDISGVTLLDVSDKVLITDLTGIQDFASLTDLYCWGNKLTSLDISQNTNLQMLDCSYNSLVNLDISQNYFLTELICESNQISNLDLGQNLELDLIYCSGNQLSSLEVSHLSKLEVLDCSSNQISNLDLSNTTALRDLECVINNLQSLNIKNGNNSILTHFDAVINPLLTCIQVDDEEAVNSGEYPYNLWSKDAIASYSEDCSPLGIDDEILAQSISLYPNPVSNILTIDSEIPLIKVEIYSVLGKKVKEINSNFSDINIGNLSAGLYLTKIYSEKGGAFRKIIKY